MEIEAELQEIMIFEAIPGHTKILANSVFTRAFPEFYAETTFVEDFPNFILEGGDFTRRAGSDASVVYVCRCPTVQLGEWQVGNLEESLG